MSVRVKICGITSIADAQLAVDAGADALGLVFYEPSPRAVTIDQAAEIARAIGPFVTLTGLFVNAQRDYIEQVLAQVPLNLLQFHGDESPEFCQSFSRPYMKAVRMKPKLDVNAEIQRFDSAQAILLDAYKKGVPGGTGESFDWQRVPKTSLRPIVLAGGLEPDNINIAIRETGVGSVDVSGGVERGPGQKSLDKVQRFIRESKRLDYSV